MFYILYIFFYISYSSLACILMSAVCSIFSFISAIISRTLASVTDTPCRQGQQSAPDSPKPAENSLTNHSSG